MKAEVEKKQLTSAIRKKCYFLYKNVPLASFEHCIYPGFFRGEIFPDWFDSRQTRSANALTSHVQKLP